MTDRPAAEAEKKPRFPVPELDALKPGTLEQWAEELPEKPTETQLASALKSLDVPGLESVEVRLIGDGGCDPYEELIGLERGAGQRINRVVLRVNPTPAGGCRETIIRLSTALTGYGAYTLTFWKKAVSSEPDLFNGFFRDISAPRGTGAKPSANLHRTMLFHRENHEGIPADHLEPLLTPSLVLSNNYRNNLIRFVNVAAAYGVFVQVCLFSYHGVTGTGPNDVGPPKHFTFPQGSDALTRFRTFFKVGTPAQPAQYQAFQTALIDAVAQALRGAPNVIWEVGNELRIPGPETSAYNNTHLTAWIDWVARRIRQNLLTTTPQLISTSTGTLTQAPGSGVPNEQPVNQLQSLDHACFHEGQWKNNIPGAVSRAQGYSDRHVILDTDGSNGVYVANQVQGFATTALSGTLKYRASFDHKGATPGVGRFAVYNQGWLDNIDLPDGKRPRQFLTALSNARAAAGV